ncbi:MAG: L-glutamate gamma-semialdehyde dehydrogenase [Marivivens sp.]|nr:L-glutamate gamma-semialdehyde dehydrogenase [Marivivens sp.]
MPARPMTAFTRTMKFASEADLLQSLIQQADLSVETRTKISARAAGLVRNIRTSADPSLMEHFLSEYGLSTREGVALMCLAEAMLRVPDADTIDALIEDKIAPSDWGKHLGEASSSLVNASTWALMLTGRVLDDEKPGMAGVLRGAIKRLGEPVIRTAVGRAMKEMGRQFVLGETIAKALDRAAKLEAQGYTYSYDMLGEAARTAEDARRYAIAYSKAIDGIAASCTKGSVEANPGISIKLSALHPRYEVAHEDRVMAELVPVVLELAQKAKAAGMGFNIDAEEQDRLVLSLKVIEAVLSDDSLAGWDGFGVVVQAYGKRAGAALDWLYETATRLDRRIMVRLVKGAYWDTEMKLAQVQGLEGFSLFTSKVATDVSYRCRIYAPVGAHRDLLAYLVRRLLENGANSSFVHQIVDEAVSPELIATDPFEAVKSATAPTGLVLPSEIFGAGRTNAKGWDLSDEQTLAEVFAARDVVLPNAGPITVSPATGVEVPVINPATGETIATVVEADSATVERAIADAKVWYAPVSERAAVLRKAADLYEENYGLIFAALAQEAGKTLLDAVGEVREAVDFLRYYADQAEEADHFPRGIFTAISPWNFPLAIFTGQIAAALAVGNAVLAKPAEQTPVVAAIAVRLMIEAGVPASALQLLPGQGGTVGAALTSDKRIAGVVFTGSTDTALIIRKSMAKHMSPSAPLIAETGGLNAMIVDSTALPEQAVRDVVASAFQSAGQRCSALRCLYIQEDVAPHVIDMIKGAMDELVVGDPWSLNTDVGPVIDQEAYTEIGAYIEAAKGSVLHQLPVPSTGNFIAPTLIKVNGIEDLEREIFGPVLHVATFKGSNLQKVIDAVNAKGFGLTFGLHTRIDNRVQEVADGIHVGNLYVNRNQIGAVVGSQPFGGEGLSGTGPKAGGPQYLYRFAAPKSAAKGADWETAADLSDTQDAINAAKAVGIIRQIELPGPTGEANTLSILPRGPILCMGPGVEAVAAQVAAVEALGGVAIAVQGELAPSALATLNGFHGAIWWGNGARPYVEALARRKGPIIPLITDMPDLGHVTHERHLCIDTTAAGGNAALLAG